MNADAARPLIRRERREKLDDLAVDVHRDEATAIGVEARDGPGIVLDDALQRQRWPGLEAEEKAPERAHGEQLECGGSGERHDEAERLSKRSGSDAACTESDEERKEEAWRQEGRPVEPAGALLVTVCGVPGVDIMSGMRPMSPMSPMSAMADVMPSVPMSAVPVSTAMPAMRESADGHDAQSHGACRQ